MVQQAQTPNMPNQLSTLARNPAEKMADDLRSQGYTPEQANSQTEQLAKTYTVPTKPVMVADVVNPRTLGMLKTAASVDTPSQGDIIRSLVERAQDQKNRLNVDVATNISPASGMAGTVADIDSKYKNVASPLYDKVREIPTTPDKSTADFFNQNRTTQQYLSEYAANRARDGRPLNMLLKQDENGNYTQSADGFENVPSMSDLIDMRKDLASHRSSLWDDQLGKYKQGKEGTARVGGTDLGPDRLKDYVGQIDNLLTKKSMDGSINPDGTPGSLYQKALDIHSDGESIKKAASIGNQILSPSMTTEDFRNHFNSLDSDAERSAMRAGGSSSITNSLGSGGLLLNKVSGRSNSTNLMDKLNVLGLNDEGNSLLNNSIETERTMQDTNRTLMPRFSPSGLLGSTEGADSIPGMAAALATNRWGSLAAGARNFLSGKGKAAIPDVADKLNAISTMNPEEFSSFLEQYHPDKPSLSGTINNGLGALSQYAKEGVAPTIGSEAGGLTDDSSDKVLHININGLPDQ
jgi:hypothetical protein